MKIIVFALVYFSFTAAGFTQPDGTTGFHNFPIIVSVQFHSLSMPFRHMELNFKNIGIGIGTEVGFNGTGNAVQQVNAVWFRNKAVGNGLLFYTQAVWRPGIGSSNAFTEWKLGAGYLIASSPTKSFRQVNGEWRAEGHKGKGMFVVPAGVSVGYSSFTSRMIVSPFVSYQFMVVSGYNASVPIVPETLIQAGTRIQSR